MKQATGDAVAIIDADLQDPPEVILSMLEKWQSEYDIVYGIRRILKEEGRLKRWLSAKFYQVFRVLADTNMPLNSGDFALLDRNVVDALNQLPEKNRFLRGLRSWVGFRQAGISYERAKRAAGETKYNFRKSTALATNAILNFSVIPLTYIFYFGLLSATLALFALIFFLLDRIIGFKVLGYSPQDFPGFTATILSILFFSGVQLISVGILGAYIGRLYQEVKNRPSYIVNRVIKHHAPDVRGEGQRAQK